MSNLKLGVEVVSAHDLVPKDGHGSSSAYVELHFDHMKFRTTIKERDLNPVWNESFYFNISDPNSLHSLTLEAYVYNHNKAKSKSFLGYVRIAGTSFVPYSDAVVFNYPLEKRGIFSSVRGELGLRVFVTDDPSIRSSNSLPAMEPTMNVLEKNENQAPARQIRSLVSNIFSGDKSAERHTFHHLPNTNRVEEQQQQQQQKQQQEHFPVSRPIINYGAQEMNFAPQAARVVNTFSRLSPQLVDYALKETSPHLGGGKVVGGRVIPGDRPSSTYDLVEKMQYIFVRVVKARDLPTKDVTGSLDPYVEVRLGNYRGITKHFEKNKNPEWNEVFAFSKENLQSTVLEVVVKDKDMIKDDFVGFLQFDLNEVPTRVPPDSPLAPEWYRLLDINRENKSKPIGELMLAVWFGTQADEAFPDAWHSDAISSNDGSSGISTQTRSKVYHSPRLWYVRVNVIEAQDVVVPDKSRFPDVYVKVQIGNQILKTKSVQTRTMHPLWNEEFMFVASEPFDDPLILSLEDRVGPRKDETVGLVIIPLNSVEKRADDRYIRNRWYNLEKSLSAAMENDQAKKDKDKFFSRVNVRICLDGGYHVLDESTHYSSDLRPTVKQLWKPSIGVLELGILSVEGLHPIKTRDGKGTSDTFCVAKYGHKWVRTRTIINSLRPKYNEQYTWEVYDPATVLTVGVFDNGYLGGSNVGRDLKIGKVRIRISTLEIGRVYTHVYPLLVLHPSGIKKMGELHLAIRFSCTSMVNLMHLYSKPLLPKMHYIRPLSVVQQDMLRHQAVNTISARLSRAEPPLRKEVIEYMSDVDAHLWSMRRSKANFFRIMSVFSGLFAVGRWFGDVCLWKTPITTILMHALFVMLVFFPELILSTVFLYMFVIGVWNWWYRPRYPPHMNTRLSYADSVHPDELQEEFDTFPSGQSPDIVRMRYDRLRSVAGRIQTVVGDMATQGERIQALLSWRDPRATTIFVILCLVAAIVFYVTPIQLLVLVAGFYLMRHPRLRHKMPSGVVNFFRRLPARSDSLL